MAAPQQQQPKPDRRPRRLRPGVKFYQPDPDGTPVRVPDGGVVDLTPSQEANFADLLVPIGQTDGQEKA